jgi:flavodoxin
MKTLIAYYSETGNTEMVANSIYDEVQVQEHYAQIKRIDEIPVKDFEGFDLIFLGSACHDSDLTIPMLKVLDQIPQAPTLKLAGFATHATFTPEGGEWERRLYEQWAGGCYTRFGQTSKEKGIDFLGYFSCQGAASPPIESFIKDEIFSNNPDRWDEYVTELRKHPNETDCSNAREFARKVLARYEMETKENTI